MTLWEILKANKTGIAPDMFTMLAASKMNGGRDRLHELSGIPPLSFTAKGKPLTAWSITGNTVQNGTPTPENPVEVQAVGDRTANLFDKSKQAGNIYVTETAIRYGVEIPVEAGIYTTAGGTNKLFVKEKYGTTYGTALDTSTQRVITLPQNGYILIYAGRSEDYTVSNIMLNAGSTALPYEPYGYKIPVVTSADGTEPITTQIYLPTPLYRGEVMRSDGSRDVKWGKLVLTGEETWNIEQTTNFYTDQPITNALKYRTVFCTHQKSVSPKFHFSNENCFISNTKKFNFQTTIIEHTVEAFKSWLADQYTAGTPVTIWYILETPTTETFTAPQIPTLNGTTVIDVDTAVKPESMTIKYRR